MSARLRLVAVGLVAATLAAACSSGTKKSTVGSTATTGSAVSVTTPTTIGKYGTRVSAGGTPDPNGVLRFGVDFSNVFTPNTFDPAASLNSCDKIDQGLIYDTLTQLDPQGNLKPGLAQSWDFTPGGTSLTLHLRPNVKFSDGTPEDAAAVKASILKIKTSPLRTSLAIIKDINVVDPTTLQLDLSSPTPADLLYAWNDLDGMVLAPSSTASHPVGSGPYVFVSADNSKMVLKKNPDYWNAAAYQPAEIDFVNVGTGPPSVAALKAGSIDMTQFMPESLPVVKADPSLGYNIRSSHEYLTIEFRLDTPPVNNQLVRQAINYAIDRNEINNVILGGTGIVTDETFAPDQPIAYNPAVANEYIPYNPDKAKQLLAQAGFPNGITFSLVIPGGITMSEREAPLLQNEMAKAGITVKIVSVDPSALLTSFYIHKENDAIALPYPAEEEYARELYDKYGAIGFTSKLTGSVQGGDYEQLMIQGQGTLDPATLKPIAQQLAQQTTDKALEAPIAFEAQLLAWNYSKIGGSPNAGSDPCRPDFEGFFIKK
ncbi:MAG TPA: ABC transporter substrate-binding protein [Acidimicrobiales bacterium]|nr:ABC transporter substrate-binding protein [Acidimicrobiales bacterium]